MSEKVIGVDYPVKGAWYKANLDPRYSFRRGPSRGFITNARGVGFHLHGSTRPKEIVSLCAYLDLLESKVEEALLL